MIIDYNIFPPLRLTVSKTKTKSKKITPLMQQYAELKAKHPDAILLFRVGDFYETFGEDAVKTAHALGIILTKRNNGGIDIELAGFPYHSLDNYLPRLVRSGFRVAICEQLEKPSKEKKIVKRGVTDVITPGLALSDNLLNHKENNYLAAVHQQKTDLIGIAFLDISTGEFHVSEGNTDYIKKLLHSFMPSEVLISKAKKNLYTEVFGEEFYSYPIDDWVFQSDYSEEKLKGHFDVSSLKGFGIQDLKSGQISAGAVLHYLELTKNNSLQHISKINRLLTEDYMWLDNFTIRNLEILRPQHRDGKCLMDIIDYTVTAMGARKLRKWILMPLLSPAKIHLRQEVVDHLRLHYPLLEEIDSYLHKIVDLERVVSKIATAKINPKEIEALKSSLESVGTVQELLKHAENSHVKNLAAKILDSSTIIDKINATLVAEPPISLQKGHCILEGVDEKLDELKYIINNSKELLVDIQKTEAEKTGIANLKIGFNNVFGYFLEVTNKYKNKDLVPDNWIRKQTLTNSERYITEELKELESKILTAQDQVSAIEQKIYAELIAFLSTHMQGILLNASILAELDCFCSFAKLAYKNNYCKPLIDDSLVMDIKDGRHPVIEQQMEPGTHYVPNDTYLENNTQQIILITGPNMSGKSAVLRQTALICLLAQTGSFVPATSAHLGIVDKLFTRVGASDNISSGESTFMVEMNETSNIMNNFTPRSLIILDEIGRGTSTYDGISIAWSIAEYLHENKEANPKTLFATHYHELNELSKTYSRIKNYNVSTRETGSKVVFLRKLVEGGSKHSFGIHVAKMAGMPKGLVERANEILHELEKKSVSNSEFKAEDLPKRQDKVQLQMFSSSSPVHDKILNILETIDINAMTPVECMLKLAELKDKLQ